tara:strand:+ start:729 stop:890 length:162 start_codon:yes stop_codon:yes gene_type:complete
MSKKYGVSFSLSRLIGIQTVKQKVAKKTGIPTTKLGFQRKIGAFLLSLLFGKK